MFKRRLPTTPPAAPSTIPSVTSSYMNGHTPTPLAASTPQAASTSSTDPTAPDNGPFVNMDPTLRWAGYNMTAGVRGVGGMRRNTTSSAVPSALLRAIASDNITTINQCLVLSLTLTQEESTTLLYYACRRNNIDLINQWYTLVKPSAFGVAEARYWLDALMWSAEFKSVDSFKYLASLNPTVLTDEIQSIMRDIARENHDYDLMTYLTAELPAITGNISVDTVV